MCRTAAAAAQACANDNGGITLPQDFALPCLPTTSATPGKWWWPQRGGLRQHLDLRFYSKETPLPGGFLLATPLASATGVPGPVRVRRELPLVRIQHCTANGHDCRYDLIRGWVRDGDYGRNSSSCRRSMMHDGRADVVVRTMAALAARAKPDLVPRAATPVFYTAWLGIAARLPCLP